jgi:predicted transport protein
MRDPPRPFLKMVRTAIGDENLAPQKIRESVVRVWGETGVRSVSIPAGPSGATSPATARSGLSPEVGEGQRTRASVRSQGSYDESHHVSGKPQEVIELYRAVDRFCMALNPGNVQKLYRKYYIAYCCGSRGFCDVHIFKSGLRVWLRLKYSRLENPPPFARDVSTIGHWGNGDLELDITSLSQLDESARLVRSSYEAQA